MQLQEINNLLYKEFKLTTRLPKTVVIRKKITQMRFQFFLRLLYVYLSEQLTIELEIKTKQILKILSKYQPKSS